VRGLPPRGCICPNSITPTARAWWRKWSYGLRGFQRGQNLPNLTLTSAGSLSGVGGGESEQIEGCTYRVA